jgi:hypothetical protein
MTRASWTPIYERHRLPRGRSLKADRSAAVDEFMDGWVCWREACEDVRSAYERWNGAPLPQRALAFGSYRAALEREEQAALVYAIWTDRLHAGER